MTVWMLISVIVLFDSLIISRRGSSVISLLVRINMCFFLLLSEVIMMSLWLLGLGLLIRRALTSIVAIASILAIILMSQAGLFLVIKVPGGSLKRIIRRTMILPFLLLLNMDGALLLLSSIVTVSSVMREKVIFLAWFTLVQILAEFICIIMLIFLFLIMIRFMMIFFHVIL